MKNITDFTQFGNVTLPIGQHLDIVYPVAAQAICQLTYTIESDNYQFLNGSPMSLWLSGAMQGNLTFTSTVPRMYKQLAWPVGNLSQGANLLRCETLIFNFPGLRSSARLLLAIDGSVIAERIYERVPCPAQTFAEEWVLFRS
jgi:hypothetical protein